jgi:AcrR family transcriptional regulator
MPRPRFEKLSPEKRERLLQAAATEFATHGYDDASMNQILEKAGVSKGAAYYYFDDKADLFITVLDHYAPELAPLEKLDLTTLNADNFWTIVLDVYRQVYLFAYKDTWTFGLLRASAQLYRANPQHPVLAARSDALWGWSQKIVRLGQELGVVRTDLPEDLMMSIVAAVDTAADEWFLAHWQALERSEIERLTIQTTDALRRLLLPKI